jgi:two-component system, chemotaxis family, protein-glutamate methylesterase/glutaminase
VTEPIRVLIVDDSAFMRRAVERMLSDSTAIRVVGAAANGEEAVTLACELRPDVVVMDVNMPRMNGLDALGEIMKRCPTPVLMMSTLTRVGARVTVRALELGAVDFIDKSQAATSMDIYQLGPQLRDKVLAVARTDRAPPPLAEPDAAVRARVPERPTARPVPADGAPPIVVAIGASTGGPRALSVILPALPADLRAAVLVAQHMPPGFTTTLADRLDERCAVRVREAADGDELERGTVLIAPGGRQMRLERAGGRLSVSVEFGAPDLLHHPSVDLMMESVARSVGKNAIGVVLTGMGQDGAVGLRALREAGARTLVESAETAVIHGMPRAAAGAAEIELPLERIAETIAALAAGDLSSIRGS